MKSVTQTGQTLQAGSTASVFKPGNLYMSSHDVLCWEEKFTMPVYSIFVHNIIIDSSRLLKMNLKWWLLATEGLQPPFFSLLEDFWTLQACWPDAVCFSCYSICARECLRGRVVQLHGFITDIQTAQPADNRQTILTPLLHFCSLLYLFFHILSYFSSYH